jgi:hypothetical protein
MSAPAKELKNSEASELMAMIKNKKITESIDPYGLYDVKRMLNYRAPEDWWVKREIEMDFGDGSKLASYLSKKGVDVKFDSEAEMWFVKGKYHFSDCYFYPYEYAYEEEAITESTSMKLNEGASSDEFNDLCDLMAPAVVSLGGDFDDAKGRVANNGFSINFTSAVNKDGSASFEKSIESRIEQALSNTRFGDWINVYVYKLTKSKIANNVPAELLDDVVTKFDVYEILVDGRDGNRMLESKAESAICPSCDSSENVINNNPHRDNQGNYIYQDYYCRDCGIYFDKEDLNEWAPNMGECPACGDTSLDTKSGKCTKCSYRESLNESSDVTRYQVEFYFDGDDHRTYEYAYAETAKAAMNIIENKYPNVTITAAIPERVPSHYKEWDLKESADYKVKFFQVFEAPKSPKENGKMIGQRGTLDDANAFGEEKVGKGNYIIKAVCTDGKIRPIDNDTKSSDYQMEEDFGFKSGDKYYGSLPSEPSALEYGAAFSRKETDFEELVSYTKDFANETKAIGHPVESYEEFRKIIRDEYGYVHPSTTDKLWEIYMDTFDSDLNESTSLIDKKFNTLGKAGKPMYLTPDQLSDMQAKFIDYSFEETSVNNTLPKGQKAYIAKKKDINEALSPKAGDRIQMDYYAKTNNGAKGTVKNKIGELCWIEWDDGTKSQEIQGFLKVIKESLNENSEYIVPKDVQDKWGNQPILHDEDQWQGKYKTFGDMWAGEGYKLEEASYGGAFDIEDDAFFTREELNDFGYTVCEHLNETFFHKYELQEIYLTKGLLEITVVDEEGTEFTTTTKIDMRTISKPRDLEKYMGNVVYDLQQQVKEYEGFLNEDVADDIDTPPMMGPEEGPKYGISSLINQAIQDELKTIDEYNSLALNARSEGFEDIAKVIDEINTEENKHVGQLQEILKIVSPNAEAIDDGEDEGEEQLED